MHIMDIMNTCPTPYKPTILATLRMISEIVKNWVECLLSAYQKCPETHYLQGFRDFLFFARGNKREIKLFFYRTFAFFKAALSASLSFFVTWKYISFVMFEFSCPNILLTTSKGTPSAIRSEAAVCRSA